MDKFVVAIDGPAGSGKSSISEIVSKKLGFTRINTGAMYRAIAVVATRKGIKLDDESEYDFLDDISVIYDNGLTKVNGVAISDEELKGASLAASKCSKLKRVRDKMLIFQRNSAIGKVLMDGRDIGTVVFPDADLKIYLDASAEERAKRRYLEIKGTPNELPYDVILKEINERDYQDMHREIAPLKKADDAVLIDTTSMTIDMVVNKIVELINEKMR